MFEVFPFLIGKVLTSKNNGLFINFIRFPFLIGKVLTYLKRRFFMREDIVFPFLIGKVLTVSHQESNSLTPESFHSL